MGFYRFRLKANEAQVLEVAGSLILVDAIDGAAGVDITPMLNGSRAHKMPGRRVAFRYRTPYDAVELRADADCTVAIFLTNSDVSLGFTDQVNVQGSVMLTNGDDSRVPVDIGGGTVNVTASNVGVSNTDAQAVPVRRKKLGTLAHKPAITVNDGAAQLVVAEAGYNSLRFRNASESHVIALGGVGVTMANAAIVLQPGDMWVEEDAPGAAWYATSDADGADLRVMGMA